MEYYVWKTFSVFSVPATLHKKNKKYIILQGPDYTVKSLCLRLEGGEKCMAVTIRDIAELAGVSIATVSRVINNDQIHRVTPGTAKKVLDAIVALNYSPNENARNLRNMRPSERTSLNIGVLLTSVTDSYDDNFFHDILMGIQSEAATSGHTIRFTHSLNASAPKLIEEYLKTFSVDGVILLGRMNEDLLYLVRKNTRHLIYAGLNPVNQNFDEVFCNGLQCAKTAVRYLASCGYKRIGYIGTAVASGSSMLINEYRYDGYISAMNELGFPLIRDYIIDTPLSAELAYTNVNLRLAKGGLPQAYFCANDICAVGVLKALKERKIKVPQDVAIISIDDIDAAALANPALTTIHIPRHEIGIYSVRILSDQIETRRKYPIRVELPYHLIVRRSCKTLKS